MSNPITAPELVVGFFILSFLFLEVFNNDTDHLQWLNAYDKVADYIFKLIFIYHLPLFIIAIYISKLDMSSYFSTANIIMPLIASLIAFIVILTITNSSFKPKKTKSIFETFNKFIKKHKSFNKNDEDKFNILISIEDKTFFNRNKKEHTSLSKDITLNKIAHISKLNIIKIFRNANSLLLRGHATIEMQLIRTIGLDNGYDCTIKRKAYEFIYADMYFNALERNKHLDNKTFKKVLLMCYIESVSVKINSAIYNKKTIHKIFKKNFRHLTNEEFFVWCLGLPHYREINNRVVDLHKQTIEYFRLDKAEIIRIIETLKC